MMKVQDDIAGGYVMHQRRAGFGGRGGVGHRGQRVDIHENGLGCVLGLLDGFSNHQRHRIANETDLVGRQDRLLRLRHVGPVAHLE